MSSEQPSTPAPILIKNYLSAIGRIGLAALFVPLLAGLGIVMMVAQGGNVAVGAILILAALPFLWIAGTTPIAIRIDDHITIGSLFRSRTYPFSDIKEFRESLEKIWVFTPGSALLSSLNIAVPRNYKIAILQLPGDRKVKFQCSHEQYLEIRNRLWLASER